MGLKVKAEKGINGDFPVGITSVKIKDFKVYRDKSNAVVLNSFGNFGFEAIFEDEKGRTINEVFWWSKKAVFWLKKLFRAIHTSEPKPKYKDIIGKKLWLSVGKQYMNNDVVDNPTDFELKIFDFTVFISEDKKPAKKGDPAKGEIGGEFIIELHTELKSMPLPKPIKGDTKAFMNEGIVPNVNFLEEEKEEEEEDDDDFRFA